VFSVKELKCFINNKIIFSTLSFNLFSGDILQVVGINGSGKTTLLKIIAGLFKSDYGDIKWNNISINLSFNKYLEDIIFIGHKKSLHMLLTPLENITYQMSLSKFNPLMHIETAFSIMKISNCINNKCIELSEGQCQKIVLSRLLLQKSKIWILDEPFSYLDFYGINLLNKIISNFLYSGGIVIISDHNNHIRRFNDCKILNLNNYKKKL